MFLCLVVLHVFAAHLSNSCLINLLVYALCLLFCDFYPIIAQKCFHDLIQLKETLNILESMLIHCSRVRLD